MSVQIEVPRNGRKLVMGLWGISKKAGKNTHGMKGRRGKMKHSS